MPVTKLSRSVTLRVAALFSGLFVVLTGLLMAITLWIVQDMQTAALRRGNDADTEMVVNGFNDEGIDEAVEVIRQRLGPAQHAHGLPPEAYLLLQSADGRVLAGNLSAPPRGEGEYFVLPDSPGSAPKPVTLVGRLATIGTDARLFVGRDVSPVAAARVRIIDAFLWVTLGAFAIAGAVGIFLGRRFAQRVAAVARACKSIVTGRLNDRIESRGRGDEWDQLAAAINGMLDRMAELLENLRQVSSDIAHDMRTPLARMRHRLEGTKAQALSTGQYASAVSAAIEETDQILSMFEATLQISQIEAGNGVRKLAVVNLSELYEHVYRMYLPVAEDYAHRLIAQIDIGLSVRGDAELLTQMFANLIENAIHHTPSQCTIRLVLQGEAGTVMAAVQDDGPGIPAEQTEKVLRRFYRLGSSRSTAGHGLGLALVAAVVQLHQAGMVLEDAGPGLRVTIRFPAIAA